MAIARALVKPPARRSSADREAIVRNAALAGLRVELPPEPEDPGTEVWPEHWLPLQVAQAMDTQINAGFGGAIGWRYEALPTVYRALGVTRAQQREIWDDLREIERGVLRTLREEPRG